MAYGSDEWIEAVVEVQQWELTMAAEFDRCIGQETWFERVDRIAAPYRAEFMSTNATALTAALAD